LAGKLGLKIVSQSFHNGLAPARVFLFTVNGFSDFQVKREQLVVDRPQRLVLALANRCLEGSKELRIFWRGDFHRQVSESIDRRSQTAAIGMAHPCALASATRDSMYTLSKEDLNSSVWDSLERIHSRRGDVEFLITGFSAVIDRR
jgi:hypothetical protein